MAWAKASRLSRSLTSVNGGGSSIGSEPDERLCAVGVSRTSSFLFSSCKNNLSEPAGRRESASGRIRGLIGKSLHMADTPKTILICSCEDTMRLDAGAVKRGCRNSEIAEHRQLCRAELDQFRNAAKAAGSLIVGCTQEAPLFANEAGDRGEINFVNLRE